MTPDRRDFLKATGAAAAAAALGACTPDARPDRGRASTGTPGSGDALDPDLLGAVAAVVLPSELGASGQTEAVAAFRDWARAYEPHAELNHGYGTSAIRHGPADPVPAWDAQLDALDAEARRRHGRGLAAVDAEARDALIRAALDDAGDGVPSPLSAPHVALALLAYWADTPGATDRCYRARISPQTCRGIADAPLEPEALT